jgi:hypothetical protein
VTNLGVDEPRTPLVPAASRRLAWQRLWDLLLEPSPEDDQESDGPTPRRAPVSGAAQSIASRQEPLDA